MWHLCAGYTLWSPAISDILVSRLIHPLGIPGICAPWTSLRLTVRVITGRLLWHCFRHRLPRRCGLVEVHITWIVRDLTSAEHDRVDAGRGCPRIEAWDLTYTVHCCCFKFTIITLSPTFPLSVRLFSCNHSILPGSPVFPRELVRTFSRTLRKNKMSSETKSSMENLLPQNRNLSSVAILC